MAVRTPRRHEDRAASANGVGAAAVTGDLMVDWPTYLAPWINDIVPGSGQDSMYVVGAIEILAGVLVALSLARLAVFYNAPRR
jgi:hypothetical protein